VVSKQIQSWIYCTLVPSSIDLVLSPPKKSMVRRSALESKDYYSLERGMQAVLHLRLISPFVAIRQSSQSPAFFTVPKGAVIEASDELHQPGLVSIKLGDHGTGHRPRLTVRQFGHRRFPEWTAFPDTRADIFYGTFEVDAGKIRAFVGNPFGGKYTG